MQAERKEKLMSVAEVAELHSVTPEAVYGALWGERLAGERVGRHWIIREADARRWTPREYTRRIS